MVVLGISDFGLVPNTLSVGSIGPNLSMPIPCYRNGLIISGRFPCVLRLQNGVLFDGYCLWENMTLDSLYNLRVDEERSKGTTCLFFFF